MTREDAIQALKDLRDIRLQGVEWTDALDMAISALKAIPCEEREKGECPFYGSPTLFDEDDYWHGRVPQGGDLISRADAVNAVHKYFVDLFNDEPYETDEDGDEVFTDMKSVNALLKHNKEVSKAIKALPSAEAVSREVYDKRTQADEEIIDSYRREFSEVASAEAVQGWIPCSERLPKDNREVLISCEWGIDIGQHEEYGWRSEWINHYDDDNVLAWMPLPTPYKGGDDE